MRETQGAMPRQSLLEYFQPDSRPAEEIAIAWRRGYRMVRWTYGDLFRAAAQFARELEARGIVKGDRVLLWGENSGEWVAAFLGCMFRGAIAVPMDAIAERKLRGARAQQAARQTRSRGARTALTGCRHTGRWLRRRGRASWPASPAASFSSGASGAWRRRSKLCSPREPRPSRAASCSRTATFWRISSRSKKKSTATGVTNDSFTRCAFSIFCRSVTSSANCSEYFCRRFLAAPPFFSIRFNPAEVDADDSRGARVRARHRASPD